MLIDGFRLKLCDINISVWKFKTDYLIEDSVILGQYIPDFDLLAKSVIFGGGRNT